MKSTHSSPLILERLNLTLLLANDYKVKSRLLAFKVRNEYHTVRHKYLVWRNERNIYNDFISIPQIKIREWGS